MGCLIVILLIIKPLCSTGHFEEAAEKGAGVQVGVRAIRRGKAARPDERSGAPGA